MARDRSVCEFRSFTIPLSHLPMRPEVEGGLLVEVAVGFAGGDEFEGPLRAGDADAQ